MSELLITAHTGGLLQEELAELAALRIQVFREYPYLYDGDAEYEASYLETYAKAADAVIVTARDGNRVVGAATGLPLASATPHVVAPFQARGDSLDHLFYYGESVLLAPYRGRGIGRRFLEARERHARSLERFDQVCFCAVERPLDHPRRPANHRTLEGLWAKQGFVKQPQLRTTFSWRDLDEDVETPKPMVFWVKSLA
ncbi:GNAT family N-acetyltransferase [Thiocapsa imhoffii]|uniref:GNAT family N-acetyltransferase n=1 Tax=Thiocapsa imhoffii TaxID=382777 RepID=A0A9X1B964_9GAMM|nr:GNAT family N-acetyltransferase [Thiocapsa imhoffii]MBK1645527.1 GNAT family N-acetyltransferase [Thiocapsa imhoffii]